MLPSTQRYRMGVLSYGPLSSGWLSGRVDPSTGNRASLQSRTFDLSIPGNQLKLAAVQQLTQLAAETEMPLAHLLNRVCPVTSGYNVRPYWPTNARATRESFGWR